MDFEEVWKDCPHYEGLYQVSNKGRVWSIRRNRYLKLTPNIYGYIRVKLTNKYGQKKMEAVHRLVALAFIPNPDKLPQVNHKDENKQNNCANNLEWCDAKYNNTYGSAGENLKRLSEVKKYSILKIDKITNTIIGEYQSATDAGKAHGHTSGWITWMMDYDGDKNKSYYFIRSDNYALHNSRN